MGRRLRLQHPDLVYHVTNKCAEDRLLLRPDSGLNAVVELWLARAVHIYHVELFAYCFMGNHFHLLVRAPQKNLHLFMKYFQRNLACSINRLRGRKGSVFPRRYRSEPVLDDNAADGLLGYVLLNPVRARLVAHARDWPGCSAVPQLLGATTDTRIPLVPLDSWRGLSSEARIARIERILEQGAAGTRQRARGRGRRGRRRRARATARLTTMSWRWRPQEKPGSPQPWCHASRSELREHYLEGYRECRAAYTSALEAWRRGIANAFPGGTVPPGWLTCAA